MRNPLVRAAVAALLFLGLLIAVALIRDVERRASQERVAALDRRIDPLFATVADLALTQAGYVTSTQAAFDSLERVPASFRALSAASAELSPTLRSPEAAQALQAFADATARLAHADARARDHLLAGDVPAASRVLFLDARDAAQAMLGALATIRRAETEAHAAERGAVAGRAQAGLALLTLLWVGGLIALVRLPRVPDAPETVPSPAAPVPSAPEVPQPSADLAVAADLCTRIARIETTDGLAELLKEMAARFEARVILWVGAGEELFPVVAHGYDPRVVQRLGTVSLRGENATAAAWRTQTLQVVQATGTSQGALVAPVCGPGGCVAALAVELPQGREHDPAIRAGVTIVAAQLASLVAGWPAR